MPNETIDLPAMVSVSDVSRKMGLSPYVVARLPVRTVFLGRKKHVFVDDLQALLGGANMPGDDVVDTPAKPLA